MHFEIIAENDAGGSAIVATEDPREALASFHEFEAAAYRLIRVRLSGKLVSKESLQKLASEATTL